MLHVSLVVIVLLSSTARSFRSHLIQHVPTLSSPCLRLCSEDRGISTRRDYCQFSRAHPHPDSAFLAKNLQTSSAGGRSDMKQHRRDVRRCVPRRWFTLMPQPDLPIWHDFLQTSSGNTSSGGSTNGRLRRNVKLGRETKHLYQACPKINCVPTPFLARFRAVFRTKRTEKGSRLRTATHRPVALTIKSRSVVRSEARLQEVSQSCPRKDFFGPISSRAIFRMPFRTVESEFNSLLLNSCRAENIQVVAASLRSQHRTLSIDRIWLQDESFVPGESSDEQQEETCCVCQGILQSGSVTS